MNNSAVDGSLGTSELCATTLGQGWTEGQTENRLDSDTDSNNVCYKLWELIWSGSGHYHLFVDKFVSSGESKNESQHHSFHLHDKYIGLVLTLKREKKMEVQFLLGETKVIVSVVERNIQSIQVLSLESNRLDFLSFNRMSFGIWHILFFEIPILLLLVK